ncbi:hypothetical protein ACFC09_15485 [Streptomyces sp. NPDC056161]|uniref:hypothetical protein n=1 Tax=Streptomyces sp. NPDC056161 TaxID=3345732 RepID=UPI0035E0BCA3
MTKRSEHVSDPVWLTDAFSKPGATIRSVATAAGCDEKTVRRWKARYGVASRPMSENASLRQSRTDELPATTLEVIEGELLGDGNLNSTKRLKAGQYVSASYMHSTCHRPYLEWLDDQLQGMESKLYGPYATSLNGTGWALRTPRYTALLPLYRRWYDPSRPAYRRKVVPQDLRVTPRMALHWYLGDGTLAVDRRSAGTKPIIRLSTDGFELEEVERLAAQLTHCRARIGRFGTRHRIVLDSAPFLEWIGPCPVPDIYGYKWRPRA